VTAYAKLCSEYQKARGIKGVFDQLQEHGRHIEYGHAQQVGGKLQITREHEAN